MNLKGFTLIEMIVVLLIMSIVFSIVVLQYSKYINSKALLLGREQIVNDIRAAQSYTLNTLKANGGFPMGGYGVNFGLNLGSYIVFADGNGNKRYDVGEKFQDIDVSGGITISNLKVNNVAIGSVDLVFRPPYGVTYINGNNKLLGSFINLEIEIKDKDGNIKTIMVRSSGLIE